jgi:hypothetical protein
MVDIPWIFRVTVSIRRNQSGEPRKETGAQLTQAEEDLLAFVQSSEPGIGETHSYSEQSAQEGICTDKIGW